MGTRDDARSILLEILATRSSEAGGMGVTAPALRRRDFTATATSVPFDTCVDAWTCGSDCTGGSDARSLSREVLLRQCCGERRNGTEGGDRARCRA